MDKIKFYLPEMTRAEVKDAAEKGAILLIPIATIEQHFDHLPMHTDIDNVTEMVKGVAKEVNSHQRVLVGAPIWFSPSPWSPESYPGYYRVKMRREVYMDALNDILESYLRFGGFKKIVLVNGHGGETEWWIREVVKKLMVWDKMAKGKRMSLIWPDWEIPSNSQIVALDWISFIGEFASKEFKEIFGGRDDFGWHGGEVETSLQLYLHPELVDMDKAKSEPKPKKSFKFAPYSLSTWHRQFIITNYSGYAAKCNNPTLATKKKGEKIFKLAVKKLSEFVKEFCDYS